MALLQLAIDATSTRDALRLVDAVYPYFDIAEIGTPLLIEEGLAALEAVRERCPDKQLLADTKIADAGRLEATSAFRRGADFVTVLGVSDDVTVRAAVEAAEEHNGNVMIDMIHVADLQRRSRQLERLGVHVICLHTAHDVRGTGIDPLAHLQDIRATVQCPLAIAGGMDSQNSPTAVQTGADIIVVGGAIARASDPRSAAAELKQIIDTEGAP